MKKTTAIILTMIFVLATFTACKDNSDKNLNSSDVTETITETETIIINKNSDANDTKNSDISNTDSVASDSNTSNSTGSATSKPSSSASKPNSSKPANTTSGTTSKPSNNNSTLLYNDIELSNYVIIGDYLGIEVDTNSKEFKELYKLVFSDDVSVNKLYKTVENGKIANGDIVNLDYEGKIDGVKFDGGTAKGYDLEIGSGTFIDDFEEELIGVSAGETKDVTAKFPTNYHVPNLAGKEAIFTCKVNKISRPMSEADAYSKMKFKSEAEYKKDITKRVAKSIILSTVCENAKIKAYPEYYVTIIGNAIYEHAESIYKAEYNQNFEDLLKYNNISATEYKKQAANELMYTNMVMYDIFNLEKLTLDPKIVEAQNVSQPIISQSYAVQEIVLEHLYNKAKIK